MKLIRWIALAVVGLVPAARADCLLGGAGVADARAVFYLEDGQGGLVSLMPDAFGVPYLTGQVGFDGRVEIAGGAASGHFDYFSTGNGPMNFFVFAGPPPSHGRATLSPLPTGASCSGAAFAFDATDALFHVSMGNRQYDSTAETVSSCRGGPTACDWDAADLRIERRYTGADAGLVLVLELSTKSGGLRFR